MAWEDSNIYKMRFAPLYFSRRCMLWDAQHFGNLDAARLQCGPQDMSGNGGGRRNIDLYERPDEAAGAISQEGIDKVAAIIETFFDRAGRFAGVDEDDEPGRCALIQAFQHDR